MYEAVTASPIGRLVTLSTPRGIAAMFFEDGSNAEPARRLRARLGAVDAAAGDPHGAGHRLERYFAGELGALEGAPLDAAGTPFQRRVWDALRAIAAGETTSYGALARRLGTSARAMGAANGRNPISLFVPCHRVIGHDGALVGYAWGVDRKRWLLRHEDALS